MSNELQNVLNEIKLEKDTNLLPENIKKDVKIFDIVGTLEEGGTSKDVPVKLFKTQEEMQADANAEEGDLAIVYRSEIKNATVDSKFQTATFPDTVVLSEAMTDYTELTYRATDSSIIFDGRGHLDNSGFTMDCWVESDEYKNIRIEYTSEDGITYIRTDTLGNPVDFTTEIYYTDTDTWNDRIGKFIQVGGSIFEGLFKNTIVTVGYGVTGYSNITNGNGTITATEEVKSITNWLNKINSLVGDSSNTVKKASIIILDGVPYLNDYQMDVWLLDDTHIKLVNTIKNSTDDIILKSLISDDVLTLPIDTNYCRIYDDDNKWYFTQRTFDTIPFVCNILIYQGIPYGNVQGTESQTYLRKLTNKTNTSAIISYLNTSIMNETVLQYIYAPTQLSITPDYVYEKEFYGKNGIENGTLTQGISNSFTDTNAAVYSKIQNTYNDMEPRVLTNDDKTIDKNIYFIPVKIDGTPLLDTSSVTDMRWMFSECTNLTTISLLNTSSVTDMTAMFNGCTNLTTIPLLDTSSVTSMSNMFYNCTNLTTIPLLDTSRVTNMNSMFNNCTNLTTIPQLDTSSGTDMGYMFDNCTNLTTIPELNTIGVNPMNAMFNGCTNLTTIPLLDTSSATSMDSMFRDCPSLSDESLNNILAMCTNAVKITHSISKTLKSIGLTSAQANKCKTLSNYSAFTSAGWTTGY